MPDTTIPDLPPSSVANDTDQMLLRQPAGGAGVDRRTTVAQIRNIDVANLSTLTSPPNPQAGDNMIIARGGVNHRVQFQHVGFVKGTRMWFFSNSDAQIPGWTQVSSGDTLLAVKGGSTYTQGGLIQGNWQQTSMSLDIQQIPRHRHSVVGTGATFGSGNRVRGRRSDLSDPLQFWQTELEGGNPFQPEGNAVPHNHGNSWRPLASVGIICVKD